MKFRFSIPGLVATLAFSGAMAFQAEAQAKPPSRYNSSNQATVFQCIRYGKAFATIAQRGDRRSAPMIVWESYVFGPEYTPQQRCNNVSQKLTNAVAQNGGKLRNLLLTTGRINDQTVICYINSGEARCNRSNTLFTLKPENARDPGAALAGLLRFGQSGSGTALRESAGGEEDVAVDMEAAVEEALSAGHESAGGDEDSSYQSVGNQNSPEAEPSEAPNPETGGNQGGF